MNELFTYGVNTIIMRNHTTLQLKLKKNSYTTIVQLSP